MTPRPPKERYATHTNKNDNYTCEWLGRKEGGMAGRAVGVGGGVSHDSGQFSDNQQPAVFDRFA